MRSPLYRSLVLCPLSAKSRIDHVAQHISFTEISQLETHNEFVPPILVVQIQMPSDSPPLFEKIEDGPGWAIVMYFKITEVSVDTQCQYTKLCWYVIRVCAGRMRTIERFVHSLSCHSVIRQVLRVRRT